MHDTCRSIEFFPVLLREVTVTQSVDVTENMRRITLGGDGLGAHREGDRTVDAFSSVGFDDDVRLIFPDPLTGLLPDMHYSSDGQVDWRGKAAELYRAYTVRSVDPHSQKVVIDFARHGSGLAENWSRSASVGDTIYMVGPRATRSFPSSKDFSMFCGDETALPAIGRGIEQLPRGHKAIACIEVATRNDIQVFRTAGDLSMQWAIRAESQSLDSVVEDIDLPSGDGFFWAAGEAELMKKIRRYAKDAGFEKDSIDISGYWRTKPNCAERQL